MLDLKGCPGQAVRESFGGPSPVSASIPSSDPRLVGSLHPPCPMTFYKDEAKKSTFIELLPVCRAAPDGRIVTDMKGVDLTFSTALMYCNDADDCFIVAGGDWKTYASSLLSSVTRVPC